MGQGKVPVPEAKLAYLMLVKGAPWVMGRWGDRLR